MTTEFTGSESNSPLENSEASAFAATPVWERRRKARRFGGLPRTAKVAPVGVASSAAPRPVSAGTRDANGLALVTVGLAAGIVAIAGTVGWQAMQGRDMAASPMEMAANEVAPPPVAAAPAESVQAQSRPNRIAAPKPAPRVRPAQPASAEDLGVNTATTLPDVPQPYTTLEPSTSPAPPALALTPPPATEIAPPVIPTSPPFAAEPATAPDLTTPPT